MRRLYAGHFGAVLFAASFALLFFDFALDLGNGGGPAFYFVEGIRPLCLQFCRVVDVAAVGVEQLGGFSVGAALILLGNRLN